jgi:hypothetical protein
VNVALPSDRTTRRKLRDVSQHLHAVVAGLSRSSVSRRRAPSPCEAQDRNPHPRGA